MNPAIREARKRSKSSHPTSAVGFCLREVRECLGVGPGALDAIGAWDQAEHKHRETDPRKIPRGVPVFWRGGKHGHVALSTGVQGRCYSTDIRRAGYFDQVPIDEIGQKWGYELLGWTEDLNGKRVVEEGRGGPVEENTGIAISGTVLVVAIAGMFIAVVAAVVALSLGLPESQNPAGLAAQLLAAFAALVVGLGTLFKLGKVEQRVTDAAENTEAIREQTNGGLDRRIRELSYESMRQALTDHLDKAP